MSTNSEPLLAENKNRFVIFPIQHHDIWEWYKKSEGKDNPWKCTNKNKELDVYDQIIFKYPPEIKKLEVMNNFNIIRKTLIRYGAPLLFFMLII